MIKFDLFLQPIAYNCSHNPKGEHCRWISGELSPMVSTEYTGVGRTSSETVRDSINGTRFDHVVDLARSFFILHHLFLVVVVGDSFW